MQLWKLYTKSEEEKLGNELRKRYWEEGWSQKRIIEYYRLSYETFNEFRDKYGLRKSPDQYNRKKIDRNFTKAQLDDMAAKIKVDFLDNLLTVNEIAAKYNISPSDFRHIRDRYGFRETDAQHWERTKRANKLKHGVEHMSNMEGHSEKSLATYHKNYGIGSSGRLEINRRFYDAIENPNLSFEEFCNIRDTILSGDGLKELLESVPIRYRSYLNLEKMWHTSFSQIQESVEKHNLQDMIKHSGVSISELAIENELKAQEPGIDIVFNSKEIIPPLELDMYLPKYRLAIEVNGLYWHCDEFVENEYHQQKSKRCLSEGIQLYHFFDEEDVSEAVSNIFNIVNRKYSTLSDTITTDFAKDNGAYLVKHGYRLDSLTKPRVLTTTKYGNVFDAGSATFSRNKRGGLLREKYKRKTN